MKLKYPNRKWRTKEGEILYIERMETSYIVNCINMLNFIPYFFYNDSEDVYDFIMKGDSPINVCLDWFKEELEYRSKSETINKDSEKSDTMLVDDLIEEVIDNRFQALELE